MWSAKRAMLVCFLFWFSASICGCAATDGEGGEEEGDEEQGGDGGKKEKKEKGQKHQSEGTPERGMLRAPGQGQQMRPRTNVQSANGYSDYSPPQQYQTPQYVSQPQQFVDHSPIEHTTYRSPEALTRHPSINMDWQTLSVPK